MRRIGPATRLRFFFAALTAGAAMLGSAALLAPSSEAAPGANCIYYSDESHTTVVGKYGRDCCNNQIAWGTKTQHYECGGCFLCTPPPR
ncbi:DUF6289 family protein [Sorangium sp. So ce296]|uniref:Secreted protein n=1 Tax=Sorangium cellulosum TaxID=56 RepID=A0A150SBZ8_SORCE|nr:hypothetical protein BE20_19155 [Sorangium cellulosum]KYF96484.1 hypothetical protein BE18_31205 [Sorangium cellulosum]